jgi:formamidopyrimidine-DNA glycosylase
MPELPEVETFARALRRGTTQASSILGLTIQRADTLWPGTIAQPSARAFKKRIAGQRVVDIGRRAKYLIFHLDQDKLLLHLRMSGDLLVNPVSTPPGKHTRLVLYFDNQHALFFNDPRKFGRAWLVEDTNEVLGNLGPEPLDPGFTAQEFFQRLSAHKRQIKPLLLDQNFISGIGNIYADESLHLARIHPLTTSKDLTAQQTANLLHAIRQVLEDGIQSSGASIDWVYRGGDFQNHFRVYGRTGEMCPECGTVIEKMVVAQRGTHFCPHCQPFTG